MNVNNTLISLAIFWSNLPQSKYETGFSIRYPLRKLTNSRVCVCVRVHVCFEHGALHKPVQHAKLSAAKNTVQTSFQRNTIMSAIY
jgi:hypothetical protein